MRALLLIAAGFGFTTLLLKHIDKVSENHQESYQAWIKQTGNPKDLTFDEFVALSRTGFFGPK